MYDMFLLMLCHCVTGGRLGEMMNCLASRESPIQLLVYQINAWFQMNIAGNRSNELISIAYIINQCHSKFLYPITFFQFFFVPLTHSW